MEGGLVLNLKSVRPLPLNCPRGTSFPWGAQALLANRSLFSKKAVLLTKESPPTGSGITLDRWLINSLKSPPTLHFL